MTQEEIDAKLVVLRARKESLKSMIASGIYQSRHGDTSLTFRSFSELERALAMVNTEIRSLTGKPNRPGYVWQNSKGYGL